MSALPDPVQELQNRVTSALRAVLDPEVGINIVDLGLVYGIEVNGGRVQVQLTMTTPTCPLGEQIADEAADAVRSIEGVSEVAVELVWDPPWSPARMAPSARESLGWGR